MMIRFLLILVSFVAASFASAAPMTSDEINDLVKRLESHYENKVSLQANFREERHMSILKEALVNQVKLWFTPPDKFRGEKVTITYSTVNRESVSDSTYQFNAPAGTNITTTFGS